MARGHRQIPLGAMFNLSPISFRNAEIRATPRFENGTWKYFLFFNAYWIVMRHPKHETRMKFLSFLCKKEKGESENFVQIKK